MRIGVRRSVGSHMLACIVTVRSSYVMLSVVLGVMRDMVLLGVSMMFLIVTVLFLVVTVMLGRMFGVTDVMLSVRVMLILLMSVCRMF